MPQIPLVVIIIIISDVLDIRKHGIFDKLLLSAFSSAKADSVQCAFSGYSKAVIEEYRLLALISKGGHSYKRVENRMQILAYYVNNFDNKVEASGIIPV